MNNNRPNFFIVGQPKAGTTALYYLLSQHPNIFMPTIKEPDFFCIDLHVAIDCFHGKETKYHHTRDKESYLNLFQGVKNEKAIGEASTDYLYSSVAAKEIHKFNPQAKIIIIIREPVSWMYSWYYQNCFSNGEFLSFEDAVEAEPLRRQGKLLNMSWREPSTAYYLGRCNYVEQVKRYLDIFPKDQVKIIIYDEFQNDNQKIFREVLEFLEVDSGFIPKIKKINERKKINFLSFYVFLRSEAVIKFSRIIIPSKKIRDFLKKKIIFKLIVRPNNKKHEINPEFRLALNRRCRDEVVGLGNLLKKDLVSFWGYDKCGSEEKIYE